MGDEAHKCSLSLSGIGGKLREVDYLVKIDKLNYNFPAKFTLKIFHFKFSLITLDHSCQCLYNKKGTTFYPSKSKIHSSSTSVHAKSCIKIHFVTVIIV